MTGTGTPFTERELGHLASEPLGRLASVSAEGMPHVVPTGFAVNRELSTIDISGYELTRSKKFRDIRATGVAAFVVDGLHSVNPWRPWGIEIRARAEAMPDGPGGPLIRLHPQRIVAWGIDTHPYQLNARDVPAP